MNQRVDASPVLAAKPASAAPVHSAMGRQSQAKYVSLTNLIALLSLGISCAYLLAYGAIGQWEAVSFTLGLALAILTAISLNQRGHHYVARHLLMAAVNITVFVFAAWLGRDSGIYLSFFATMADIVLIFDPRDWRHSAAALTLPLTFLVILIEIPRPLPFLVAPATPFLSEGSMVTSLVAAAMLLVALYAFSKAVRSSEHQAEDASLRLDQEMGLVRLLQEVAIIANNAEDLEQAVAATSQKVREHAGWGLGRFVRFDAGWQACGFKRDLVAHGRASWCSRGAPGEWCDDCEAALKTSRDGRLGAEGGVLIGVPVTSKGLSSVIGMLLFSATPETLPSVEMLANLDNIGRQLGIVDERRRAAAAVNDSHMKMIAAAKMATLGEMAGGIAHEINNPLAVIQGHLARIKKYTAWPDAEERTGAEIQAINATIMRITKIVNGLRAFARDSTNDPFEVVPVARLVQETLALSAERFKNRGIGLTVTPIDEAWTIECRPSQISQVLVNFLNNAFDAVEPKASAAPKVELSVVGSDDAISFTVSDDGPGIPVAIQGRILEPFFTTKPVGRGTGLGLSISKGLVESHGGSVKFRSRPGETVFSARLPRRQRGRDG